MFRLSRRAVTGIVKEAFQVEARDRAGLNTAHAALYTRDGIRCGRRNYDCEPGSWFGHESQMVHSGQYFTNPTDWRNLMLFVRGSDGKLKYNYIITL
jgi:hypothetical protein